MTFSASGMIYYLALVVEHRHAVFSAIYRSRRLLHLLVQGLHLGDHHAVIPETVRMNDVEDIMIYLQYNLFLTEILSINP